jgi:hypothetical protein
MGTWEDLKKEALKREAPDDKEGTLRCAAPLSRPALTSA